MSKRIVLIGCGILKKEVNYLIQKNGWPVETHFLCSSLHVDFNALYESLEKALATYSERETVVFYGTCHPLMDKMLNQAKTFRTPGQNCVEILVGKKMFKDELSAGAFFLMEDWARGWDKITGKAFRGNKEAMNAIFQEEHQFFLALRTPCSEDFKKAAEEVSRSISLPLQWRDVSLDHLEKVLEETIAKKIKVPHVGTD